MAVDIIGLAGVAGAGKDTFFDLLSKEVNCQRYALADELKREVNEWTKKSYGINALTCSRLEKEIIRPFLVFHGVMRRTQTEGRYWIEKLEKELDNRNHRIPMIQVITDIRFSEYEKDEVHWLKEELGGKLIHISMYTRDENKKVQFKEPANEYEQKNDQILRESADWFIEWPEISPFEPENLKEHITDCIDFIKNE